MAWLYGRLQNASIARVSEALSTNNKLDFVADRMPSVRSFTNGIVLSALGAAQNVLGVGFSSNMNSPLARAVPSGGASATCNSPQLSCHNSSAVSDLCCFNAPGGSLLQTQFWDTNPAVGPSDSWTIHGLWPDNCDGTYEANCDENRAYTNITDILKAAGQNDLLSYMQTYWLPNSGSAETFWEHEWGKHGTCISTLDPDCYHNYQPTEEVPDFFNRTVSLFQTLPTYKWLAAAGITPSSSTTYSSSDIQAALKKNFGYNVYLGCNSGELDEVWYFYNVRGSLQNGDFVPTDSLSSSSCPSTGIKYLPKSGSSSPTSTTTSPGSSPTGGSFSGSGYLNVVSGGKQNGCIISAGTWYTSGTCATFSAAASGNGFTLSSSKGNCGVVSGTLTCGSGVSSTVFTSNGNTLLYSSSSAFSTDSTPSGSTQAKVYSGSSHSVGLTIQWQSK